MCFAWISWTIGCTTAIRICDSMAFWFSGHSSRRISIPNATRTQPYARCRCSCTQSRMLTTSTDTGFTIGRKIQP